MKKIMCSILLVGIILFCVACGNESSVVSLSPEEEQLNNYNTICGKLYSEQNYLGELIIQADETIQNTQVNDVTDSLVLENLSRSLSEAKEYQNYTIKTLDMGDEKISSEVVSVENAYNDVSEIVKSLEDSIYAVEESVQEKVRIEEEKKEAYIWPGKTYTWESKDANGYVVEVKMKFGSWIKATDRESLNKAWQMAGGEGEAPDVSTFSVNNHQFKDISSAMTFATLEYTNKTEGYDFSEQYPYECNATLCTRPNVPYDGGLWWQGKIYFSSGASDMNRSDFGISSAVMKSNHWGPVTIAFALDNVFGPNYDDNGNPALDEVSFYFGGNEIRIPAIWKSIEPISLSESKYSEANWLASPDGRIDLWFQSGVVTENGWDYPQNGEQGEQNLVLVWRKYFSDPKITNAGNSDITVDLSKLYTKFEGDIVVAAACKDNSNSVKIKIYGDDKLLWESENIVGSSDSIHFNVNLSDVQILKIESVTNANNPGPSVAIVNDLIS